MWLGYRCLLYDNSLANISREVVCCIVATQVNINLYTVTAGKLRNGVTCNYVLSELNSWWGWSMSHSPLFWLQESNLVLFIINYSFHKFMPLLYIIPHSLIYKVQCAVAIATAIKQRNTLLILWRFIFHRCSDLTCEDITDNQPAVCVLLNIPSPSHHNHTPSHNTKHKHLPICFSAFSVPRYSHTYKQLFLVVYF